MQLIKIYHIEIKDCDWFHYFNIKDNESHQKHAIRPERNFLSNLFSKKYNLIPKNSLSFHNYKLFPHEARYT